jgi:hypothetical protein
MSVKFEYIFVFALLLTTGCIKSKIPLESNIETFPGEFIIDSYTANLTVSRHPESDSLWGLFSYSLKYHVKNQPGTIEFFRIKIDKYLGIVTDIEYSVPTPVNKTQELNDEFWIKNNFSDVDRVTVDFKLSGVFWKYDFNNQRFFRSSNTFDQSLNQKIAIQRE